MIVIVGAGPAGLAAAFELQKHGLQPLVLERQPIVGGISRTEEYKGFRFDIGGHRFYTKVPLVNSMWHEVLGDQFERRPRLSRIYYQQKFFPYPLELLPTLRELGIRESTLVFLSYLAARLFPSPEETTFDEWISNRFGKRLFNTFFKSYTEKVWGIPTSQIRSEWAAQRIQGLSLSAALRNSLFPGNQDVKTLIEYFNYPIYGPGMMWDAFRKRIEGEGAQVICNTEVTRLYHEDKRIVRVELLDRASNQGDRPDLQELTVDEVVSSMPLQALISRLEPAPPQAVLSAARSLNYRAFILTGLILKIEHVFPDNWIYIHEPGVRVGRIQNFKNWSAAMVPDQTYTSLGMEYFCDQGDELWQKSDEELLKLAKRELGQLGLADPQLVVDGCVIRQAKAYPVYDTDYQKHLAVIRDYLSGIDNLQTVGRNGMHRYNNQDHSMLTGLLAARNVTGEEHDLWQVNTERSYYEIWTLEEKDKGVIDQPPTKSLFIARD
jgi:protoporphyrinogen oxidase